MGNNVYVFVTFIIVKLPMLVADIRISGARSRMDMLPDYFEAAATSKNWKIALQLKLRNFCMRPARRIIDTGRASYVWAERAEAHKMVEFSQKIHSLPRVIFDKNCFKIICQKHPILRRGAFRISAAGIGVPAFTIKYTFLFYYVRGGLSP